MLFEKPFPTQTNRIGKHVNLYEMAPANDETLERLAEKYPEQPHMFMSAEVLREDKSDSGVSIYGLGMGRAILGTEVSRFTQALSESLLTDEDFEVLPPQRENRWLEVGISTYEMKGVDALISRNDASQPLAVLSYFDRNKQERYVLDSECDIFLKQSSSDGLGAIPALQEFREAYATAENTESLLGEIHDQIMNRHGKYHHLLEPEIMRVGNSNALTMEAFDFFLHLGGKYVRENMNQEWDELKAYANMPNRRTISID